MKVKGNDDKNDNVFVYTGGRCPNRRKKKIIHARVDNSVASIGPSAFAGCTNLQTVELRQQVPSTVGTKPGAADTDDTASERKDTEEPYVNDAGVLVSIESAAFSGCERLESIHIPSTVTKIGTSAFRRCTNLTTVHIPTNSQLQIIEAAAFIDCKSLTTIVGTFPSTLRHIGASAFSGCLSLLYNHHVLSTATAANVNDDLTTGIFIIPSSIHEICNKTFYMCSSLHHIQLSTAAIQKIGSNAFSGCSSLHTIDFNIDDSTTTTTKVNDDDHNNDDDGNKNTSTNTMDDDDNNHDDVKNPSMGRTTSSSDDEIEIEIGTDAFRDCTQLRNIMLPDRTTKIGSNAFSNCINLSSMHIPDTIRTIENGTFEECSQLTTVILPKSITRIGVLAFHNCVNLRTIDFLTTTSTGTSTPSSTTMTTMAMMNTTLETIDTYALSGCSSLTNLYIPDSVTFIGTSAFQGCTSLTHTRLPSRLERICSSTFGECKSLQSIDLPCTVKDIEMYAFGASGLLEINLRHLPVQKINDYTFEDCEVLERVILPDSIKTIDEDVFDGCPRVHSLWLGNAIEEIHDSIFDIVRPAEIVYSLGAVSPTTFAITSLETAATSSTLTTTTSQRNETLVRIPIDDGYSELSDGVDLYQFVCDVNRGGGRFLQRPRISNSTNATADAADCVTESIGDAATDGGSNKDNNDSHTPNENVYYDVYNDREATVQWEDEEEEEGSTEALDTATGKKLATTTRQRDVQYPSALWPLIFNRILHELHVPKYFTFLDDISYQLYGRGASGRYFNYDDDDDDDDEADERLAQQRRTRIIYYLLVEGTVADLVSS